MLVLKNVGFNESIGVMKSIFTLGYDILQNELDTIFCDCDESFNLCVLYYNEFYHSEYNDQNISEYEAVVKFKNNNEVSIKEYLKRIKLMFQVCQYYKYTLSFDVHTMELCVENKEYKYHYNTMSEFALSWIEKCIKINDKFNAWTDEDLNRLRKMGGLPIPKDKIQDSFSFEFFITNKEIELGLYINRYEIPDKDDLYQAIGDCEMDTNDYLIATFKTSDNVSFNIFTTHNLYNVYIDKQTGLCLKGVCIINDSTIMYFETKNFVKEPSTIDYKQVLNSRRN